MRALLSTVLLLAIACGGGTQKPAEPVGQKQHVDTPAEPTPPPADDELSAEECSKLFDHIAELVIGSLEPQDRGPARAELESQRATIVDECTAGRVTRPQYQCMTRAQSMEALNDCVPVQ
jgi:hypothetical protein